MPPLLSPYVLLGGVASLLLAGGFGYYEGHRIATLEGEHRITAIYKQANAVADEEQKRAFEASAAFQKGKAAGRVRYQTINEHTTEVIHDDITYYSGECLNADGLLSVNAALAGPQANPPGPPTALPATPSTDGR